MRGGKVVDVKTLILTGDGEHTQKLNAHAEPILRRRALKAGSAKFDVVSGIQAKAKPNAPAYTRVFGESLVKAADADPKVVAITAAMPGGTGLDIFGKAHPDKTFDVGIAEQHAVTFAGGLATEGYKPFVAIYSTFLQRAYDQVVHDVALQNLAVRFCLDRAGLTFKNVWPAPSASGLYEVI